LSVILAIIRLNLPVILSGILLLGLAVYLILRMPETGFKPSNESEPKQPLIDLSGLRKTAQQRHPGLLLILAVGFVFAFHSEGFDALWQRQFLDNFQPALLWFGVIGIGANLFSIIVSEIVRWRVRLKVYESTARTLIVMYCIMVAGLLIFSLSGQFLVALLAYWGVIAVRGASIPVSKAWFNQGLESHNRATMFSLNSQIGAMGEIIGGPPIGLIGKMFSVRAALAASGTILAFTLPLLKIALRRKPMGESK
jgi:DHA3 family tetracycline resistance protein-like MFS transporter